MPDLQMLFLTLLALWLRAVATCLKIRHGPPPMPEQIFEALGYGRSIFGGILVIAQLMANLRWPSWAAHHPNP